MLAVKVETVLAAGGLPVVVRAVWPAGASCTYGLRRFWHSASVSATSKNP